MVDREYDLTLTCKNAKRKEIVIKALTLTNVPIM